MRTLFTLLVLLISSVAEARRPASVAPQPSLEFIENRGQWASPVRYAAALPGGGQLFAERDGLRLALLEAGALAHPGHPDAPGDAAPPQLPAQSRLIRGHALDLRFVNASAATRLVPSGLTAEHRNYFKGNDPAHWATDVRSYHELRYADLWPGVEAHFYENDEQRLEYDFVVAPGASPAAIGLRHDGAKVTLDALGNLQLATTVGVVRELAPHAWQLAATGAHQPVACRYRLAADGTVRFELGAYDATQPLIIDPTIVFSGYTGSLATNWGFTATYDEAGNLYSGGIAFSVGFPIAAGSFQTTFGGIIDMALIKYNVAQKGLTARVWSTYIGGQRCDLPHSLVVSKQGELLVLGSTNSDDFPVAARAVQRTFGGGPPANPFGSPYYQQLSEGSDIVVCRLAATGAALQGSTYLGGSDNDGLLPVASNSPDPQLAHNFGDAFRGDILVDAADNVYIATCTSSRNFPLGTASFQPTYRGGTSDGVVCKLKGDLSAVLWGGYLGGDASDAVYSVQLEPSSGDVYVAGGTLSANLPATAGALKPTWSGNVDGFVTRIAASGTSLVRTTYLGTSAYDQAYFVQLGGDGGVYVLGQTLGAYATTPGLYGQPGGQQFIHKLDASLSQTQLATVFGTGRRSVDIAPTAFLVDHCDRVYVCGWGGGANRNGASNPYLDGNNECSTTGLPTTAFALQSTTDGSDFYLAQFSAGLASLAYGTFMGGNYSNPSWGEHVDGGTSRFDPRGVVYQAVCTCGAGTGFPVPPGANYYYAASGAGGNCNNAAFVLNFQPDVADVGPPLTVCLGGPTALTGTPNGGVWTGPGVSGSVATGFAFTPPALGTYALTYTVATGLCSSSATRQVTAVAVPTASISSSLQTAYCIAAGIALPLVPLVGTPAGGTFSGPGVYEAVGGVGQVFNPNAVSGTAEIVYTYNTGCVAKASRQVQIVRADAGAPQTLCTNNSPFALIGYPAGGIWTGAGVSGSVATGFFFTPSAVAAGIVSLTYSRQADDKSCAAGSVRLITVASSDNVALTPLPAPMCVNTTTIFPLVASPAGGYWTGRGVGRSSTGEYFFQPSSAGMGTFTLTYYVGSGTACATQRTMSAIVLLSLSVVAPADTLLCPGTTRPFALRGGSPAGGTWSGQGVSGSAATGFFFTPPAGFTGPASLTYTFTTGGCVGSATRRVGVPVVPAFQPSWQPLACAEDRQAPLVVRFVDAGNNSTTRWDFGDGSPGATGASVTHTYQQAGYYQPRVSMRYLQAQCETTAPLAAIDVQNQPIPNIITPNGDANNQTFRLPPSCIPRLEMFSRWGQRVFEAAAYHNDWDATGHPAGVYYYLLTYPDGHRVKGWLEVMK
jgi:hypothetical protein